jgi:hypothetical protein
MHNQPRANRISLFCFSLLALLLLGEASFGLIPERSPLQPAPEREADRRAAPVKPARATCASCHEVKNGIVGAKSHFLNQRAKLSMKAWAKKSDLAFKCGICHVVPEPDVVGRAGWSSVIEHMGSVMETRRMVNYSESEWLDILHYYSMFSPELQPLLNPDPVASPLAFEPSEMLAVGSTAYENTISNVNLVDLDKDGKLEVLACDFTTGELFWVQPGHNTRSGRGWSVDTLAVLPNPGHTEVHDYNRDGLSDIVVACLGTMFANDSLFGSVVLMTNQGARADGTGFRFSADTIMRGLCRISDVRPGDFDGDRDIDYVLSSYGMINEGELGWLENRGGMDYTYHRIVKKAGGIHVPPIDLNGDGNLDFIALIAQEYEEITAFINNGKGEFEPRLLFKAAAPTFGSSGIEMVDLDKDGDQDLLFTNGDNFDLPGALGPFPYHGVQWLENTGRMNFKYHGLLGFYGAYKADAGDMDNDGDLDIVVVSLFNYWNDPARQSIIWLENDGKQNFKPRGIGNSVTHLISVDLGDLDNDGRLDAVSGSTHVFEPFDRVGRLTFWKNLGLREER